MLPGVDSANRQLVIRRVCYAQTRADIRVYVGAVQCVSRSLVIPLLAFRFEEDRRVRSSWSRCTLVILSLLGIAKKAYSYLKELVLFNTKSKI